MKRIEERKKIQKILETESEKIKMAGKKRNRRNEAFIQTKMNQTTLIRNTEKAVKRKRWKQSPSASRIFPGTCYL